MLKKATSILLVIATSASLIGGAIPYLWYIVNYEYIVTELCVNRDNPEMNCDGSCQLKKMIHKHHPHHNDEKPSSPVPQQQKIDLFVTVHDSMTRSAAYTSLLSPIYLNKMSTLWFGEPASPPPQAV